MTGGVVRISNSSAIEANVATDSGGGLQVDGGVVALSSGAILRRNQAPVAVNVGVGPNATASYTLPAPLGRWLFIQNGIVQILEAITVDAEYPYRDERNSNLISHSFASSSQLP